MFRLKGQIWLSRIMLRNSYLKVKPAVLQLLSFLLPLLELSQCQFYPVINYRVIKNLPINPFYSIETSIMYETLNCRTYSITTTTPGSEQVSQSCGDLSILIQQFFSNIYHHHHNNNYNSNNNQHTESQEQLRPPVGELPAVRSEIKPLQDRQKNIINRLAKNLFKYL